MPAPHFSPTYHLGSGTWTVAFLLPRLPTGGSFAIPPLPAYRSGRDRTNTVGGWFDVWTATPTPPTPTSYIYIPPPCAHRLSHSPRRVTCVAYWNRRRHSPAYVMLGRRDKQCGSERGLRLTHPAPPTHPLPVAHYLTPLVCFTRYNLRRHYSPRTLPPLGGPSDKHSTCGATLPGARGQWPGTAFPTNWFRRGLPRQDAATGLSVRHELFCKFCCGED